MGMMLTVYAACNVGASLFDRGEKIGMMMTVSAAQLFTSMTLK
jgi:hypothetical protein